MRFIGLVIAMTGAAVGYFLAYRGMKVDEARNKLAKLLNLPGLAPPPTADAGSPLASAASGAAKVLSGANA